MLILRAHGPHSNVPFEETIKGMKVRTARRLACGSRACSCPRACSQSCFDANGVLVLRTACRGKQKRLMNPDPCDISLAK